MAKMFNATPSCPFTDTMFHSPARLTDLRAVPQLLNSAVIIATLKKTFFIILIVLVIIINVRKKYTTKIRNIFHINEMR